MTNQQPPIPKETQTESYIFSQYPQDGLSLNTTKSESLKRIICNYHLSRSGETVDLEIDCTGLFKMFLDWQNKEIV